MADLGQGDEVWDSVVSPQWHCKAGRRSCCHVEVYFEIDETRPGYEHGAGGQSETCASLKMRVHSFWTVLHMIVVRRYLCISQIAASPKVRRYCWTPFSRDYANGSAIG